MITITETEIKTLHFSISDIYISIICNQIICEYEFRFEGVKITNSIIGGGLYIEGETILFEMDTYSCELRKDTFKIEGYKFRIL